jgi:hypothetical protein
MNKHGRKESWATKLKSQKSEHQLQTVGKKDGDPGSIVTYLFVILKVVFGV